jgi:deoxyribodipyrimidine photo-lyase
MRALVLFTRDLRVRDHPALGEAGRRPDDVVPLFVLDPGLLAVSPNRARFLTECLADLDGSLRARGGRLIVRRGAVPREAARVARETRCVDVFLTRDVGRYASARIESLAQALPEGTPVHELPGHAVVEPGAIAPQGADAYRVFTPYLRAWSACELREPVPPPRRVKVPRGIASEPLPRIAPTAVSLPAGGETSGRTRLTGFLRRNASRYGDARDDLAEDATSHLSPYLRFGCVSASEIVRRARAVEGTDAFVRQVAWRDFFRQLLVERPWLTWRDVRPNPDLPSPEEGAFEAWAEGRTGVPLVDAAMRQLVSEGWIPNRARLVAGSYLTRRLGVPWQAGAGHFMRHLVDGDPASNAGNWQWVAGTGVAPRRGVPLNPERQAHRFDPDGTYVRRHEAT